jgi:phosphocarrier protein
LTEAEVQIVNRLGLHARAAARFVHLANSFNCKITVARKDSRVDGKSILGLLTLAAAKGSRLRLTVEGRNEKAVLKKLVALVENRFGEDG